MATFKYLWENRAKHPFFTKKNIRSWAKRLLLIKETINANKRRNELVFYGAQIGSTTEIGMANILGKKTNLSIGEFTTIGRVHIALHDKVKIGERVCINDGVQILTASHDVVHPEWKHLKKPIVICDYAWIATNAIILPGVHIGYGAVVGAGAVVTKSVSDFAIAVGNPAVIISKKRATNLTYNPCEFLASNNAWLI